MKKGIKIVLCALFALSLTGCGSDKTPSNGQDKVIEFNDEELNITVDDLYATLKEKYATNYLIQEMDKMILDKEYETDAKAEEYADNQIKITKMMYGNDETEFLNALQNAGYRSEDELKEYIITNYKRDLATKDYARSQVSESEIKKYYENNVYGDITISHILVTISTTDTMTDEEKSEATKKTEEKIQEILDKLKEEGKTFEEVAKEYSEDTATSKDGGRLGTFTKGEMTKKYDKEFENAAMNLKVGEYTTKAIKSSYGYHIIYKDAEKDKPKLEEVKQTIIDSIVDENQNEDSKLQYKALIELREKYGLKINDEVINNQYNNAVNNWLYSKED